MGKHTASDRHLNRLATAEQSTDRNSCKKPEFPSSLVEDPVCVGAAVAEHDAKKLGKIGARCAVRHLHQLFERGQLPGCENGIEQRVVAAVMCAQRGGHSAAADPVP